MLDPPTLVKAFDKLTSTPVSVVDPASITTWNDSNSFFAAVRVAPTGPTGCSDGRTVVVDPTTTTEGPVPGVGADAPIRRTETRSSDVTSALPTTPCRRPLIELTSVSSLYSIFPP